MRRLGNVSPYRRRVRFLSIIAALLALTGCADALVPPPPTVPVVVETVQVEVRRSRATATPLAPAGEPEATTSSLTATTTATPAQQRIPSPSPPPTLGPPTPVSSLSGQAISVANLSQMRQLRQIGFGHALQTAIAPGEDMLAIATTAGIAWFSLPDLQHLRFDAITGGASAITFSRDGRRMAVEIATPAEGAHTIEVRQVADGALLATLTGTAPAFRADGQMIATMQQADAGLTTQLWSSGDGEPFSTLEGGYPVFSPDGAFIATVQGRGSQQPATLLWKGVDGSIILDLPGDNPTFSPDGKLLATVTTAGVHLWAMPEGRPAGSLDMEIAAPEQTKLAFTAGGSVLQVFAGNELSIWSVPEGTLLSRFEEVVNAEEVADSTLSTYGSILTIFAGGTAGATGGVQLIRTEDGTVIFSDEESVAGSVNDTSFTAVLVTSSGLVRLVDLTDGSSTTEAKLIGFSSLALSPDGSRLATATWGSDVYLWQVADGALIQRMQTQTGVIERRIPYYLSFFPDGRALFAKETLSSGGSPTAALTVWDTQVSNLGAEVWSLNAANGQVAPERWAFNPVISAFAWVDTRGQVQLQQNDGTKTTLTEPGSIAALDFNPAGSLIAVGDRRGTIQLLKTEGGYIYDTLQAGGAIDDLVFSADGTLLGARQANGTVLVWRIDEQTPLAQVAAGPDFEKFIFSADNQMLITAGLNGVAFYRLSDGQLARALDIAAQDVGIDPTGRLVAVLHDWRATLWGVP